MERSEAELIAAVLKGAAASFGPLIQKYSPHREAWTMVKMDWNGVGYPYRKGHLL